jgi:antitoxin CcdA
VPLFEHEQPNITLDEDLVRQARLLTSNLSNTVENLLREFVTREHGLRAAQDAAMTQVIDGFNSYHTQHGLLSDEFSNL